MSSETRVSYRPNQPLEPVLLPPSATGSTSCRHGKRHKWKVIVFNPVIDSNVSTSSDDHDTPHNDDQSNGKPALATLVQSLPTEVIHEIYECTMCHPHLIMVNPFLDRVPTTDRIPKKWWFDKSPLFVNKDLKKKGINAYWRNNVFLVDLSMFYLRPDKFSDDAWPLSKVKPEACRLVSRVHLTTRNWDGFWDKSNWKDAIKFLHCFPNLRRIVFDVRMTVHNELSLAQVDHISRLCCVRAAHRLEPILRKASIRCTKTADPEDGIWVICNTPRLLRYEVGEMLIPGLEYGVKELLEELRDRGTGGNDALE